MRQIRVDDARRRKRIKRGGGVKPMALHDDAAIVESNPAEVLAVHEALECLEQEDARKAEIVMLRYFAGFTVEECAKAMGVSTRTVNTEWRFARAWLHRELSKGDTAVHAANPPCQQRE
jgi:RNA polymerase sigma factor (TIGR02999 family)